jgi:putative ABC transport system permease protein
LRSALVVSEIAIAMVLLTAAGLLAKSFEQMSDVDPGFRPERVLAGSYTLPLVRYPSQQQINGFHEELLSRLQRLPGVKVAGLATSLPMAAPGSVRFFTAEGYRTAEGEPYAGEANSYVVGNFLQAMQISLLRGRYLDAGDTVNSQPVVVVNRTLAEHYWPGQNPIGKRMRWGSENATYRRPWMTVVGEVADTKQGALDAKEMAQAYEPLVQYGVEFGSIAGKLGLHGSSMSFAVRTAYDPQFVESAIRQTVRSIDTQLAVSNMQTMEQAVSKTEAPRRFNTSVISAFALIAVGLAALGIYAVIAFAVAQRKHEIGIRVALGAQASQIMRFVVSGGAKLGLLGCALGILGAVGMSRMLSRFLFQVSPFDVSIYCAAAFGVLLLSLAASLLPARRAAAVDPIEALRAE